MKSLNEKIKKLVIAVVVTIVFVLGIQFVGALLMGILARIFMFVAG